MRTQAQLAELYTKLVGYDPFEDDPSTTAEEVEQVIGEWYAEVDAEVHMVKLRPDMEGAVTVMTERGWTVETYNLDSADLPRVYFKREDGKTADITLVDGQWIARVFDKAPS